MTPAIFLDKDGTLLEDIPYNADPSRMRLMPGAAAALCELGSLDVPLIVVSNQPGVSMGCFPESALESVASRLHLLFASCGARLSAFRYCPHPRGRLKCMCRKPRAGLLLAAADEFNIDLQRSWMIGDILDDVEAGHRAGCRSILINNGHETLWKDGPLRRPDYVVRDLREAAAVVRTRAQALVA
jgi:histidinol-phosphate phosphatase family protein